MNKLFLIFVSTILLLCFNQNSIAQKIAYSNENVFVNYPDNLQLIANIGGNHHLISFTVKENPVIFIFDHTLSFKTTITIPIKFPDKSDMRIIPLENFYYLYIHPNYTGKYFLLKIDRDGNITDVSAAFEKLLISQTHNIKLGFQLIANQNQLCMVYHTDLTNIQKSTVVIVQTDSLLRTAFEHKVMYDFKRDEEKLQQEILMSGRYLFVLKTARSGTSLELMKVNLATGYTIRNTFYSSGYFYSQASVNYNTKDSTVTVSALLTEPRTSSKPKYFVFVSRMNKILVEETPLAILRSQFLKNTTTNFLLIDKSKWVRLGAESLRSYYTVPQNSQTLYQDLTMPNPNYQNADNYNLAMLERTTPSRSSGSLDDPRQNIRFSLADKNFKIINDSLVSNSRSSYTIQTNKFARFHANDKEYMVVGQRFYTKNNGLLMVSNEANNLIYTDIRVNDRNDYLLSKANIVPQGLLIPYTYKREAGLIKITIE